MATIAFNIIGTALGGPIGGAIGTLVGRQVDSALFGSRRHGARLKELDVTTSIYGQPLPRHFGRMRVGGTMIWATELVEHSQTQGSTTTYSYTANFAVALASRPIQNIGRIWADGKLLRGADGDLKVAGELRIHTGHGDQAPDPLILANEGEDRCPAHRDLVYLVFEDLDLTDYYSRIPSLTFEVIADEDFDLQHLVGDVLEDIDARVDLGGMEGFSCENALDDDLQTIDQIIPLRIDVAGEQIVICRERQHDAAIRLPEPAVATGDGDFGAGSGYARRRAAPSQRPPTVLRYYDPDRDYQASSQRASGRSAPGQPAVIELPAALDASAARALIEQASRRIDWSRDRISWRTSELDAAVAPGARVSLPGLSGHWLVTDWEWRDSGVELGLERVLPTGAETTSALAADAGRGNTAADELAGTTSLVAFELPLGGQSGGQSGDADQTQARAAVSSASSNWSGAALYADQGDGELHPLGPSGRARALLGTTYSALPPANPLLFDHTSQVTVSMIDPAMQLASVDIRQLAYGANRALVGEEMIQFATATSLGEGKWRLEGLLRGRGGTEAAVSTHASGEAFVLLSSPTVSIDATTLGTGTGRHVVAFGLGDEDPVVAPVLLGGVTLRPLAPVHPRRALLEDGGWRLSWTRRARGLRYWQDGIDMPLVEQAESYLVTLGPLDAPHARWSTDKPRLDIDPATLASLSSALAGEPLRVRQQGTHALSEALLLLHHFLTALFGGHHERSHYF